METKLSEQNAVALYHLDEGSGNVVHDTSGNGNDGKICGAIWTNEGIKGKALKFNGIEDHIKVPHSPSLNLTDAFTIEACVKGKASEFSPEEKTSGNPPKRGPFFQAVGDKIFWAANSDIPGTEDRIEFRKTFAHHIDWHIWTGRMNTDGKGWKERQMIFPPATGLEPKLQVVGEKIYYLYWGIYNAFSEKLEDMYGQLYTARSNIDGTGWKVTSRIPYSSAKAIKIEQSCMHVVGNKIYYSYPQAEGNKIRWQLWTAESNIDGTGWKAVQRTATGEFPRQLQVVGDCIYYHYTRTPEKGEYYFAKTNIDGTGWEVIKAVKYKARYPWSYFYIHKDRIYFSYAILDAKGISQLRTGQMSIDGTDRKVTGRTFGNYDTSAAYFQIVGDKVYYIYSQMGIEGPHENWDKPGSWQILTAQSNLDGTNWKSTKRTGGDIYHLPGLKGIQVVGGKIYYGGQAQSSWADERIMFGKSGSNIINKGDAYGIGLTEDNAARAFINAGQDYLFRAEAPDDTAGAIADHPIDNNWHYLAMTCDKTGLKLYVDGELKTSAAYAPAAGINPFNLIIGDSFRGNIDKVAIYRETMTAKEIKERYRIFTT